MGMAELSSIKVHLAENVYFSTLFSNSTTIPDRPPASLSTVNLALDYLGLIIVCLTVVIEGSFIYCVYRCRLTHGPLKPAVKCLLQRSIGDVTWVVTWVFNNLFLYVYQVLNSSTTIANLENNHLNLIPLLLTTISDLALGHSIFMLVILSVIRCRAVVSPHQARYLNAGRVFVGALICSSVFTLVDKLLDLLISEHEQQSAKYNLGVRTMQFVALYMMPLIVVIIFYGNMFSALNRSNSLLRSSAANQSALRVLERRQGASKRLIPLVLLFFVGWGPYWTVHLTTKSYLAYQVSDIVMLVSYLCNAAYTGFISGHIRSHIGGTPMSSRSESANSIQLLPYTISK